MITIEDLSKLKKQIEVAKEKKAKALGAYEAAMSRLDSEFKCKSLEDAKKELFKLNAEIDCEEKKLDDLLKKIEESVDWSNI